MEYRSVYRHWETLAATWWKERGALPAYLLVTKRLRWARTALLTPGILGNGRVLHNERAKAGALASIQARMRRSIDRRARQALPLPGPVPDPALDKRGIRPYPSGEGGAEAAPRQGGRP